MTESLMQVSGRFIRLLPFAAVVALLGHDARGQQNTITGYNQVMGQWNASQAARTNNSRTGTGSPVGRDDCLRAGESYFQTDATAGQNNWYCVSAGSPGSWIIAIGPITVGASLPVTCSVGQQYFVTTPGAAYGLNVCTATNTWTAQSGASGSGTVTSVSASCLPWLTCPVSTATTTPALAIGAANSQTSHQVIGTCGNLTAFAPCSLVAGDLPSIPLATGVTGTLPAANLPAPAGGGPAGGVASIASVTSGINTPETTVISYTVPANTIAAGTTYRVVAYGTCTASAANISNLRIRFGSTGTSADTALADLALTSATSGTNNGFRVEFIITFQSTTTAELEAVLQNNGATGIYTAQQAIMSPANATGLTTTSNEILQFSYGSAASTTTSTFYVATMELVKP